MTKRYLGKKEAISKRRFKMPEYDPPNAFYTQIDLPKYIKPEVFIGKEGCHLKHMTELSKCDYLWYDFKRGVIEVWGKEHRLPKALRMLKKRMDSFNPPLPKGSPKSSSYDEVNEEYRITIKTIHERFDVVYELRGSESDTVKYYLEKILAEYPNNPYFTKIVSKDSDLLIVKRSNTSD
jgi:hypothetical protein